jgi:hypothetical protein
MKTAFSLLLAAVAASSASARTTFVVTAQCKELPETCDIRDGDMMRKMVLGCAGTETATFNAGVNPLPVKANWYRINPEFKIGTPGHIDIKCDRNCDLLEGVTECSVGCFVYRTNPDDRRLRGLTREIFDGCRLRVEHFQPQGLGSHCVLDENTCAFEYCNVETGTCYVQPPVAEPILAPP